MRIGLAALALVCLCVVASAQAETGEQTFVVKTTTVGWVSTTLDLAAGESVKLTSAGDGTCSVPHPEICPVGDPDGIGKVCRDFKARNGPGGGLPIGAVIGKIGSGGAPFLIGRGTRPSIRDT